MTTTNPVVPEPIRPTPPSGWVRRYVCPPCNPLFIISTILMFVGCYLLNAGLAADTNESLKLAALLLTVNVYEAALLALAFWLIRTRRDLIDGRLLLLIQTLFLADGTFLVGELLSSHGLLGQVTATVAIVLIPVKVIVIARILDTPVGWRRWALVVVRFAAVFAVPLAFSRLTVDGILHPALALAGWWLAGLMIATTPRLVPLVPPGVRRLYVPHVHGALTIMPIIAMFAHLQGDAWVYRAGFEWAYLGPVLIGLSIALPRILACSAKSAPVAVWRVAIVFTGVAISLNHSHLAFALSEFQVLPAHTAAAAGLAALITAWVEYQSIVLAVIAGAYTVTGTLVALPRSVFESGENLLKAIWQALPRTQFAWGLIAVIGAFVMLAAGSMMQLVKKRRATS